MPQCTNCPAWAGEERWRTLCRKCFRAQKESEETEREALLIRLQMENQTLRGQVRMLQFKATVGGAPDAISPEKLRALIQLCHPDRHSDSKIANEITQWLLKLRK
jgi:NMD protein affecting ribosome stability and mRNA decay